MPGIGTPRWLVRSNCFGAIPCLDIDHNIRVEAYMPELADEITDVKITKLITPAAAANPIFLKDQCKWTNRNILHR